MYAHSDLKHELRRFSWHDKYRQKIKKVVLYNL